MLRKSNWLVACFVLFAGTRAIAQELPNLPTAQKEHELLKQFVGEWESEAKVTMGPGQEPMICKGSMKSRMLGDFWVISESSAEMMGTQVNAIQTLGYDSDKKKFIGSWVDSAMNHMWTYNGSVDSAGKKFIFEADGPNFMAEGKTAKFRDIYDFKSADHIAMSSEMQGEDGKWVQFMSADVRRKK